MPRMSKEVITHELKINLSIIPIPQKWRQLRMEKALAIRQEEGKLIDINCVIEIRFQTWLTNQMLVRNKKMKDVRGSPEPEQCLFEGFISPP